MGFQLSVKILIIIFLYTLCGCNQQNNSDKIKSIKSEKKKFTSPLTLNMSYTTTDKGNYYILAILICKEYTPYASFEIDVPDKFISKGSKKWSGEIESNSPKIVEIEVSKTFEGKEITGVFTASIKGAIFTVNQILNLNSSPNKPTSNVFQEKNSEKGEKIADHRVRK
ncbi:MAG: hypothetical protein ACK4NF_03375 [Planctomycetota bacterium]